MSIWIVYLLFSSSGILVCQTVDDEDFGREILNLEISDISEFHSDCIEGCVCSTVVVNCMYLNISGFEWTNKTSKDVEIIDLRYNQIQTIPRGGLRKFRQLNTLLLSHNKIKSIKNGAFGGLHRLKFLYLHKNAIEFLEEKAFHHLPNLEQLHLQNNYLKKISPSTFVGLTKLHRLFLQNNDLTHIPNGLFDDLENLKLLRLDENPFKCDCDLAWFNNWNSGENSNIKVSAYCDTPSNLKGRQLVKLKSDELNCGKIYFLREPNDVEVNIGSSVELKCKASVSSTEKVDIKWHKNGKELNISESRYMIQRHGSLKIFNLRGDDSGIYTCLASSESFEIKSRPAKLRFLRTKPKIFSNSSMTEIRGEQGDILFLECLTITGQLESEVHWFKDGSKLSLPTSKMKADSNGKLVINNLDGKDQGIYKCEKGKSTGMLMQLTILSKNPFSFDSNSIPIKAIHDQVLDAVASTLSRLQSGKNFQTSMSLLRLSNKPLRQMAIASEVYEQVLEQVLKKDERNISDDFWRFLANSSGCDNLPQRMDPKCTDMCFHLKYRSIDGTCNNLWKPLWGASMTPFRRNLQPQYEDFLSHPIGWNPDRLYNGFKKPSARKVSTTLISSKKVSNDLDHTHMLMQWGQFLDHDLDHTMESISTESFESRKPCSSSCEKKSPCFPISTEPGDPRIISQECIEFERSSATCVEAFPNGIRRREQINRLTSMIDGSQIYGSDSELASKLRENKLGLLRQGPLNSHGKPYLPFNENQEVDCKRNETESNLGCFLAGDSRANEQLGLLTMHTIWLREHNRIALELHQMNTDWSEDKLFEESRKIVGAELQIITYKHWLPIILGPEGMKKLGDYKGYDSNVDPSISNGFATAAFRFGHTLIQPILERLDSKHQPISQGHLPLRKAFFAPWRLVEEGGTDPILRGLVLTSTKKNLPNEVLNSELTENLFEAAHSVALDLASLNIQRGRDHGLPSYTQWRKWCNLDNDEITDWNNLSKIIRNEDTLGKLMALYGHPKNIDLWVGGVLEEPLLNGKVGPTFGCIIIDQFKRFRDGDRFFYENPSTFKPEQLSQLMQTRLSRIICDNSDNIREIPIDPFMLSKLFVDCESIPKVSLKAWFDCSSF